MAQTMLRPLPAFHLPSPTARRGGLRRALQGLAALGLVAAAAMVSASGAGCSSAKFCVGGFIRTVNGAQTCEGLCDPSKCTNPGNVCVDNLCALECKSRLDCAPSEECDPATTDGASGKMTAVCRPSSRSPIGTKCPIGNECGGLPPSCPDGSNCDYTQCGGGTCTPDPIACNGDAKCAIGKCPDSSSCVVQGCAQDQCKPLTCLSAGAGDADAYCTVLDCHTDGDCGEGYWCSEVRDAHPICGSAAPKLPGLCAISCASNVGCTNAYGAGATCVNMICSPACVTAGMGGATYAPGPWCTKRNECRLRRICDPCTTDLDCSATAGHHCSSMPMGSDKFCTADCGSDADCANGFQCTGGACVPRAGTCKGTGKFCEPCHNDDECEAGKYCSRESSGEERVCVTPIGTIACMTDADCPTSPSGQHGKCFDASVQSSPGDGVYHTCWLPYVAATMAFGCWQQNTGAACGAAADCISKSCVGADPAQGVAGTCK